MAVQLFNFQPYSPGYIQSGISVTTSENSKEHTELKALHWDQLTEKEDL